MPIDVSYELEFYFMRKEDGLSIIALIIIIVLLVVVAVIAYNKIFGQDGIVDQYTEIDTEYNKDEIVDKMNLIVKEKYIFDTKYATENNLNIEEIYTTENLLKYLLDEGYIEELKDVNDNIVKDQYYINASNINGDLATNVINENGSDSNGTKVFKIKKIEDKFMIYFVDKYGEETELGELIVKPEI